MLCHAPDLTKNIRFSVAYMYAHVYSSKGPNLLPRGENRFGYFIDILPSKGR